MAGYFYGVSEVVGDRINAAVSWGQTCFNAQWTRKGYLALKSLNYVCGI